MKKKILVRAPVLSQSGYGEQARFALRALKSKEEFLDIYIIPIPWGKTGWVWSNNDFRKWMDERITLTQVLLHQKQLQPDISLQITIPNEFEKLCPINIGYTAGIETNKVAPIWLQKGNDMNKILVVSNHAKTTYEATVAEATNNQTGEVVPYKLQTPVHVVHESTPRSDPEPIEDLNLTTDFNFLTISQFSPRKNFKNTIQWWVEEFIDQNVGLIVKTNVANNSYMDYTSTENMIKEMLESYSDRKCKVYLLHGDLSEGQMTWLYNHNKVKALVNISHGEGFGLPMFEAAREGLPVITVGWSGQTDFLHHDNKDYFQKVKFNLQAVQKEAVWPGVIEENSGWAFAEQGSYKMTLRKVFKNYEEISNTASDLKDIIVDKFNDQKLYDNFVEHIVPLEEMKQMDAEIDDLLSDLL